MVLVLLNYNYPNDELLINKHKSSKNDLVILKISMKAQTVHLLRADSSL